MKIKFTRLIFTCLLVLLRTGFVEADVQVHTTAELIQEIVYANGGSTEHGTIFLDTGKTYLFTEAYQGGENALPVITSQIIIIGNGASIERDKTAATLFRLIKIGSGGKLTLRNVTLKGGDAGAGFGGAINNGGELIIEQNTVLTGNIATNGGAVYATKNVTLDASTISGNTAQSGGGLYFYNYGGILNIKNSSKISDNHATTSDGGGIYFNGNGNNNLVNITDSTISNNDAKIVGGGIYYAYSSPLTIKRSTIIGNKAGTIGGGINLLQNSNETPVIMEISESSVINNTVFGGGGGGIYSEAFDVRILNSTIAGNDASSGGNIKNLKNLTITNSTIAKTANGTGSFQNIKTVTIQNTIIGAGVTCSINEGSSAVSLGHNFISSQKDCPITLANSDVFNKSVFLGDLLLNDGLPGGAYIPLLSNSPAINAGDPAICVSDLAKDQLGHDRVGKCDIGAVEALFTEIGAFCGDGIVHAVNGEECDDGNNIDNDACANSCKIAKCNDGARNISGADGKIETCDKSDFGDATCISVGFKGNGQLLCTDKCEHDVSKCINVLCGDGVLDAGETCDGLSGLIDTDHQTCSDDCKAIIDLPYCGNGVTDEGEACDGSASCRSNCTVKVCGDGIQDDGEACDSGTANSDTGTCLTTCQLAKCGDGFVQTGVEECDDGNLANGDGCSGVCKTEVAAAPATPLTPPVTPPTPAEPVTAAPATTTTEETPAPSPSPAPAPASGGGGCSLIVR